jgi:hypothetical protein
MATPFASPSRPGRSIRLNGLGVVLAVARPGDTSRGTCYLGFSLPHASKVSWPSVALALYPISRGDNDFLSFFHFNIPLCLRPGTHAYSLTSLLLMSERT